MDDGHLSLKGQHDAYRARRLYRFVSWLRHGEGDEIESIKSTQLLVEQVLLVHVRLRDDCGVGRMRIGKALRCDLFLTSRRWGWVPADVAQVRRLTFE